jgi:hypothetical protein
MLFTSYSFLKSCMFVSHGPFVTTYDLVEDTIIKHQEFGSQIYQIFRKKAAKDTTIMDIGVV